MHYFTRGMRNISVRVSIGWLLDSQTKLIEPDVGARERRRECEVTSEGISDGKMQMQEGQLRMSVSESEMAGGQLRVTESKIAMTGSRNQLVVATRTYAVCLLILFSIEIFGAAMPARHFSIVTNAGRQTSTISTDSSAVRRGNSFTKLATHDFDIRAARVFRTTNRVERVSNVSTVLDLGHRAILGNRLNCEEKTSARQMFAREDFTGLGSATRPHKRIQFDDYGMNHANSGASNKILPCDAVRVFKFDSSNLITTDPVSEITTPSATIIDPDVFVPQCSPRTMASSYGAHETRPAKIAVSGIT